MSEARPLRKTTRSKKGEDYKLEDLPGGGWRLTGAAGDARHWAEAVIGVREKRQAEPARRAAKRRMMAKMLAVKERQVARNREKCR